jgi:hypothetical protein
VKSQDETTVSSLAKFLRSKNASKDETKFHRRSMKFAPFGVSLHLHPSLRQAMKRSFIFGFAPLRWACPLTSSPRYDKVREPPLKGVLK